MEKTARIRLLPDAVTSKISAGEVVDAPFSVIKELVENSIDAGADCIDVKLLQSGLKKITVSDNGSGILCEDAPLAVKDHATSKIRDIFDIETISTYGFRGEALSSIAAISDFTILTRHSTEKNGIKLHVKSGKTESSPWAGQVGTTVIVENLFYNVPARKKFLKSPQTELRYAREVFLKTATGNPAVSFTFDTEQKRNISLPSAASLQERLRQIYGNETADNCYFEEIEDSMAAIFGMFSKPHFLKSSRSLQQLFINNRPVEYRYLSFLLSKAYEAVAPKGKYPAAIMFLNIDPKLVDVNIHPAKREVKLFDSKYVDGLILNLAGKALSKIHSMPDGSFTPVFMPSAVNRREETGYYTPYFTEKNLFQSSAQTLQIKEIERLYNDVAAPKDYFILGSIFNSYILVQKDNSLCIIDFHAAHERFIYDELIKKSPETDNQKLIFQSVIDLPLEEFHAIADNIEIFAEIGFDIEKFSDNSILIRAVPSALAKLNEKELVMEIAEEIRGEKEPGKIYNAIAALSACHAAARAGDALSVKEMEILAGKVFSGEYELRCPHGRPFVHIIKKEDLKRIFKR